MVCAERTLAIWRTSLGEDHFYIGVALNLLADLHSALGEYDQAEERYLKAMRLYDKVVGPDHPYAVQNLRDYAAFLSGVGRIGEAEAIVEQADSLEAARVEAP
jgi:tetratricopeptide (TPR) repeat protein